MLKVSVFAVSALVLPSIASAQEEAAPEAAPAATATASDKIGLSAALDVAYASPSSFCDAESKCEDIPEEFSASSMLINLGVKYDFAGLGVKGLFAGLDLPIVMNSSSFDPGGGADKEETSGTGLGDLSVYAGYMFPAMPDMLDVGAKLRFKAATGKWKDLGDKDEPTGSGSNNIQIGAVVDGNISGVLLDAEVGYLMQMARTEGDGDAAVDINPGDFIYADLGVGYLVADMIEPQVHILFASAGVMSASAGSSDPVDIEKSEVSWLGVSLDVGIRINEMLKAHVGYGTRLDAAMGLNLPYGYVISGKNTFGGTAAFNLGIAASL